MIRPDTVYVTIAGEKRRLDSLPELDLTIEEELPSPSRMILSNQGSSLLGVDAVELTYKLTTLFPNSESQFRFYKEGLTVVGVAGSRKQGDHDFELAPDFLKFTVSDPGNYHWDIKNAFCAEQVGVVERCHGGECVLIGFVTAENFLCRIVVESADVDGILIKAVIDTDGVTVESGEIVNLEALLMVRGDCVEDLLCAYADQVAAQMKAVPATRVPTGWCSYYFYYGQETEGDIIENASFLAEHRDSLPVEYIQIDDGWQKARGDWLESNQKKFPHGMKWLAERISERGFKPGVWMAPFLVSEKTSVYRRHFDWLLRDAAGELLRMGNDCVLDPSHPEALKWLSDCLKVIKSWGYSYFKLDFMMVATCHGAQYYDKSVSRLQAYRLGLKTIRDAVGEDAFLLGGTSLLFPNTGLVNGCRISTDVTPFWCREGHTPESPAIFNVCRNIINRGYLHKRLWINDPDCLIVREEHQREKYKDVPSLTLEEVKMLATAMIMSGGAFFLGDRMTTLSEQRLAILNKVFELMDETAAFPVDRMDGEIPRVWFKGRTGDGSAPHLLAVFNWRDSATSVLVDLRDLKIGNGGNWLFKDCWRETDSVPFPESGQMNFPLDPHACRLIEVVRKRH